MHINTCRLCVNTFGGIILKIQPRSGGFEVHYAVHPALKSLCESLCRPYRGSDRFATLPSTPPAAPYWAKLFRPYGASFWTLRFTAANKTEFSRLLNPGLSSVAPAALSRGNPGLFSESIPCASRIGYLLGTRRAFSYWLKTAFAPSCAGVPASNCSLR